MGIGRLGIYRNGKGTALRHSQLAGLCVIASLAAAFGHSVARCSGSLWDGKHPFHGNVKAFGRIGNFLVLRRDLNGLQGRLFKGPGDAQRAVRVLRNGGFLSVHRGGDVVRKHGVGACGRNDRGGIYRRIGRSCCCGRPVQLTQRDVGRGRGSRRIERLANHRSVDLRHFNAADENSKEELSVCILADSIVAVVADEFGGIVVLRIRAGCEHLAETRSYAYFCIRPQRSNDIQWRRIPKDRIGKKVFLLVAIQIIVYDNVA